MIMPIETRFKCKNNEFDFITVENDTKNVVITATKLDGETHYILDIPTAIKLSKTIRTHINLVKSKQNEQ